MRWWVVAIASVWWCAMPRVSRDDVRRRLAFGVRGRRENGGGRQRRTGPLVVDSSSSLVRVSGAIGAALVPSVFVGGVFGVVLGVLVGIGAWWGVGQLEPSALRRRREVIRRDLPFAVDLLAACVAAGATPSAALSATGAALDGELGDAFASASAALALGAPVGEALESWRGAGPLSELAPIARMLERSAVSGAALVPSVNRLASELRASRRWEIDAIARRAGVRATVPLGVCFLPAFVLLGVVPTVLAGAQVFTS